MYNAVFKKTMENARKNINIKLVTTEKQTIWCPNQLGVQYYMKFFKENLSAIEMRKNYIYESASLLRHIKIRFK